ncbi:hypothetical protein ASD53_06930 [Lysobacter sp. Root559]|uniref:NIPSNAP family protein n=1 Tax=Lysobacter sp. Root559 TaxID=1736559 RepID=UPI0006F6E4B7|nr:NIPSNAP family protein [Lysobacter sp. Root559]KQZ59292.1 hypothetical protein ASD53_06930 [Lysobacter sp. Root559]
MNDSTSANDGRHDFDFFHGRWTIRNERLRERLAGSTDWEVFEASQRCEPILGGLGNVDDFVSDWGRPGSAEKFLGMTLRLFNPETRQWSLYWAGNHDGVLEPPVVGAFKDGVVTFVGAAEHEGRPVLAKFTWDQISANAAHWHQAFSADGGKTWETNWHMWMRRIDESGRLVHDDAVIELRQYTMNPGRRDDLIGLFEREFIETQEAVGIHVIGQFRDLDGPDRYVWVRGFPGMRERAAALNSFYSGPVWQRHREAANATLLDNDDVLLLKPARPGSGFPPAPAARAPVGASQLPEAVYVAGICSLNAPAEDGFGELFDSAFAPLLRASGAELVATYLTDPSENSFPRLPVREGERVFVWFARYADEDHWANATRALNLDPRWRDVLVEAMLGDLAAAPVLLRLGPVVRSELADADAPRKAAAATVARAMAMAAAVGDPRHGRDSDTELAVAS